MSDAPAWDIGTIELDSATGEYAAHVKCHGCGKEGRIIGVREGDAVSFPRGACCLEWQKANPARGD